MWVAHVRNRADLVCDEAATTLHSSSRFHVGSAVPSAAANTSQSTISFRDSVILTCVHHLIRRLLASRPEEARAAQVNNLVRLWLAVAQLDPRAAVQERALLECLGLQRHHRSLLQGDVAVPFCYYALLLMREGRAEEALAVLRAGRGLSTDNILLKFLESGRGRAD